MSSNVFLIDSPLLSLSFSIQCRLAHNFGNLFFINGGSFQPIDCGCLWMWTLSALFILNRNVSFSVVTLLMFIFAVLLNLTLVSLLFFLIISDYAIVSTGFMVAWGLLVLWLQSFLLQMVMVTLSIITVLAIMCSCHVVSACWGLCIVSEGHNFPVCFFASCCGHSCTCSPALHCGSSCASFCCCQIISSIYPMS